MTTRCSMRLRGGGGNNADPTADGDNDAVPAVTTKRTTRSSRSALVSLMG